MTQQDKTTAEKIRTGRAVTMLPAIPALGRPARYIDGPAGARHHLLTARAGGRPAPRTIRTARDGRRIAQRRTGRLG